MKVSVITPSYNSAKFIEEVILSVKNQDYKNIEHLVIDGGSTDETVTILKKYPHLKWVSEPDKGIYDAMNKGVLMATGDWIIFLGADDVFFGEKVLSLLNSTHQKELKHNDIIYGDVIFKEMYRMSHFHKKFSKYDFDERNINHQAIFYRATVFEKVGLYSLEYPIFADWEFNLRCFFNTQIHTQYIPLIISYFSVLGVSNQRKDAFYENRRELVRKVVAERGLKEKISFAYHKTPRRNLFKKICLKVVSKMLS